MKNFNTNTKNNDEWLTPPEIIKALGNFDLDPCAPIHRPYDMARKHFNKLDDGLSKKWDGRIWLNPPYGNNTFEWIKRLAEHKSGIALIFARTETKGFFNEIWKKADAIFFFKGRLSFLTVEGKKGNTANAPSCLISYSAQDTEAIKYSGLTGKLVYLKGGKYDCDNIKD